MSGDRSRVRKIVIATVFVLTSCSQQENTDAARATQSSTAPAMQTSSQEQSTSFVELVSFDSSDLDFTFKVHAPDDAALAIDHCQNQIPFGLVQVLPEGEKAVFANITIQCRSEPIVVPAGTSRTLVAQANLQPGQVIPAGKHKLELHTLSKNGNSVRDAEAQSNEFSFAGAIGKELHACAKISEQQLANAPSGMMLMGNVGGVSFYGYKGALLCSEADANGIGECDITSEKPIKVVTPRERYGLLPTSGSTPSLLIYGPDRIYCEE